MHEKILPEGSKSSLAWLEEHATEHYHQWILAGGTGLALLLGHRISEDFDFFVNHGPVPTFLRA